jgi:hypothetical protein
MQNLDWNSHDGAYYYHSNKHIWDAKKDEEAKRKELMRSTPEEVRRVDDLAAKRRRKAQARRRKKDHEMDMDFYDCYGPGASDFDDRDSDEDTSSDDGSDSEGSDLGYEKFMPKLRQSDKTEAPQNPSDGQRDSAQPKSASDYGVAWGSGKRPLESTEDSSDTKRQRLVVMGDMDESKFDRFGIDKHGRFASSDQRTGERWQTPQTQRQKEEGKGETEAIAEHWQHPRTCSNHDFATT